MNRSENPFLSHNKPAVERLHPIPAADLVFKMTKGYRFFLGALWSLAIALCAGGPILWCVLKPDFSILQVVATLVGIGLAILAVRGIMRIKRCQLEIWPDSIRVQKSWSAQSLRLDEIEGFRVTEGKSPRLLFIPKARSQKNLTIDFIYERKAQLLQWAREHLLDLDRAEYEAELSEIKANEAWGFSEDQRLAKHASAQKWAKGLMGVSIASIMWVIAYPRPYEFALGWLAALPCVALILIIVFRGLIRFDGKKKSAYPNVAVGFITPILGLAMRALKDWHVLDWSKFWLPFMIFGCSITLLVLYFASDARKKKFTAIAVGLFAFIYGYGVILPVNGLFDRSKPTMYAAKVSAEHVSHGKHDSYYMTLAPFTAEIPSREVEVASTFYQSHPVGKTVTVYVRPGFIGIPWFSLR